ncbi:IS3 family transposase [Dethiobacter alkaliphilus]|nr:IS3 family transposase [Dethiobacter alkaliphilus]
MPSNANRYSEEFKKDAIKLVQEGGRPVNSVANDLGINAQTLRNWLKEEKKRQNPESARILELEAQLKAEKRRNNELEEAVDIFKKGYSTLRERQPETVIYKHINELSSQFPVEKMCKYLEVTRSNFYNWKNRGPSKRALENEKILEIAKKSYAECHGICGLDKMLEDVREHFPKCSRNRLYGIQKRNGLYSKRKRKFKATTDSNHQLPVAENLLNQNFKADKPGAVWVTDISYVNTIEGWLYLATVKDICTKDIVGWATADNMKTELCIKALESAIKRYRPSPGLIHHSDRGVQYCSKDYQKLLKKHGMVCSMSRKGNCYDNACAETFFGTIKCEMLYHKKYETRKEAHRDIFWYIEIFYNRKRRHQSLGYMTPAEYRKTIEEQLLAA